VLNGEKSGCPTCATSGFKPSEPAYFYIVKIETRNEEYLGFGITKNLKACLGRHRTSASKEGARVEVLQTKFFPVGHDALGLEKLINAEFPSHDTLIEGFRREATDMQYLHKLLGVVERYPYELV